MPAIGNGPDPGHPEVTRVLDAVTRVSIGRRPVAAHILCALLAGGHVLLDDVPGVGKTLLVKAMAHALSLRCARVQGGPDLLPSDITGSAIFDPRQGSFTFRPGPVFTEMLLLDEINRCPPRTQSALLEAMEEGQVTVDGESRPLPPPFLVLATANPMDADDAFPLPTSQVDRFLFRLRLGYPEPADQLAMLRDPAPPRPAAGPAAVTREGFLALQEAAGAVHLSDHVLHYLVALVEATRHRPDLELGASPRAAAQWARAAQAWALMAGRTYVIPDDVAALGEPLLAHRLVGVNGADPRETVREILRAVPAPVGASR